MIYTHAAAAIIAASLAGWAGWSVQGWRLGEQIAALKTAQAEAVNTATREARAVRLDDDLASGDLTKEDHALCKQRLESLGKLQSRIQRLLPLAEKLL